MANQNVTQLTAQTTSANTSSLLYAVTGGTTDTGLPWSVLVNNIGLTGVPTAPTAAPGTSTTQIASTAYVATSYAPLASPSFTTQATLTAASNAFLTITVAGSSIAVFNNSGSGAYGFFNNTQGRAAVSINETTDNVTLFGSLTPSSTGGIVGTNTNNNASAGSVGEYVSGTAAAVSLTSTTAANITSISLTAGDWDVQTVVKFNPAATTTVTNMAGGTSTTTGTLGALGTYFQDTHTFTAAASQNDVFAAPVTRISIASTTTVFAVAQSTFATSTMTADAFISARRVR